jgi:hypothetical protein
MEVRDWRSLGSRQNQSILCKHSLGNSGWRRNYSSQGECAWRLAEWWARSSIAAATMKSWTNCFDVVHQADSAVDRCRVRDNNGHVLKSRVNIQHRRDPWICFSLYAFEGFEEASRRSCRALCKYICYQQKKISRKKW